MTIRRRQTEGSWSPRGLQASKRVIKKVGTDGNPADVGTKYIEDGMKLVQLLSLSGLRVKRGLELTALSVATVVLQGCASIVHAEGTVIGRHRCDCESVARDGNHSSNGMSWLVAVGWVAGGPCANSQGEQRRGDVSDCSKGRFVATETHGCWQRAGQWKSCVGMVDTICE